MYKVHHLIIIWFLRLIIKYALTRVNALPNSRKNVFFLISRFVGKSQASQKPIIPLQKPPFLCLHKPSAIKGYNHKNHPWVHNNRKRTPC